MKKLIIRVLVLLAFSCLTAKSQNINNPFAQIKERSAINIDNKKVRCYELNFGREIKKCVFSADSAFMYLYLSNSKKVYCYDFKNNKIVWETSVKEPILSNIGTTMLLVRDNFLNTDRKIDLINANNGKLLGETSDLFNIYYDDQNKVGLKVGSHWNPSVININSGRTLWTNPKDSDNFSGIHDFMAGDSNIILLSNNVYNIKTDSGLQWTYPLHSSDLKKHCRFGGYATHYNLSSINRINEFTHLYYNSKGKSCGMESNILKLDNSIIVADKEKIVNLDYGTGKENWKTKLPFELTGRTELFNSSNNIILVNTGSCEVNDEFSDYGLPYVAVFNPKAGELIYKALLSKKPSRILYIKESDDFILLVFNDRITQLNKKDFSTKDYVLTESQIKQFGYFQPFIDRANYVSWNLGRFLIIYPQDFVKHDFALYDESNDKSELINAEFLFPTQKGTMAFNKQFEYLTCYAFNQLGIKKFENDRYSLIMPVFKGAESWHNLGADSYYVFIDKATSKEIAKVEMESLIYHVFNNYFIEVLKDGILIYELN